MLHITLSVRIILFVPERSTVPANSCCRNPLARAAHSPGLKLTLLRCSLRYLRGDFQRGQGALFHRSQHCSATHRKTPAKFLLLVTAIG